MKRRPFRPETPDSLENRVVLSHAAVPVPPGGVSVVSSGLFPGQQVINRRLQPVVAEINQAFDLFQNDYDQARATYFASILNQPTPTSATTSAFSLYTTQRVSLLAQQIISSFLQYPAGTSRSHGQPSTLKQLVSMKVYDAALPSMKQVPGSLLNSLQTTIPQPGTSAPTASLYSLSQDEAIASARAAVINGVTVVRNGYFGNQYQQQSHHK